jgi:hypothetical protein
MKTPENYKFQAGDQIYRKIDDYYDVMTITEYDTDTDEYTCKQTNNYLNWKIGEIWVFDIVTIEESFSLLTEQNKALIL